MKPNEVMVGDWVFFKGKPDKVSPGHIVYMRSDMYSQEYQDGTQPIPLTPEILEKNGFEKDGLIELYNHYCGMDNRVALHDDFMSMNSRNMWNVHVDSEDYCTIANCELTYVHELQHILRLCKIDKEIVV